MEYTHRKVFIMTEETRVRGPRVKEPRSTTPDEMRRITEYLDRSVPEKHKLAVTRALLKQMSRTTAIKTKCLACSNFDRSDVRGCTVIICPLWAYRPYQVSEEDENEELD